MSHLVSKTAIDEVGVQDMAPDDVDKDEEKKRGNHRCQPEGEKTGSDFCFSADTGSALSGLSNCPIFHSLFPMYRISGGLANFKGNCFSR